MLTTAPTQHSILILRARISVIVWLMIQSQNLEFSRQQIDDVYFHFSYYLRALFSHESDELGRRLALSSWWAHHILSFIIGTRSFSLLFTFLKLIRPLFFIFLFVLYFIAFVFVHYVDIDIGGPGMMNMPRRDRKRTREIWNSKMKWKRARQKKRNLNSQRWLEPFREDRELRYILQVNASLFFL